MQNGRVATTSANVLGVLAAMLLLWPSVEIGHLTLWAGGMLILLLWHSLYISNVLMEHRHQNRPQRVYWRLLLGIMLIGGSWAAWFIVMAQLVSESIQHVFLLLIFMITTLTMVVSLALREYFITNLFATLFPIAWWYLANYWEQDNNLLLGLFTLGVCAILLLTSNSVYLLFRNMISLNWEREALSRELGDLTRSLRERNRQLNVARSQLTELANVDELTGLGNRRVLNKMLQAEINRARRSKCQLSLIILDVDYFKRYNDTYGHPAGDKVLRRLAELMQCVTTRAGEVVTRYGGEEFVLLLPGANEHAALRTAERLKELVFAERMAHNASEVSEYVTISQGVATVRPGGSLEPSDLIRRADQALYEAKGAGRNAIALADG
ncbi:MAG: GGDEF domain-containing protein [Parahaliea sp.]